MATKKAIKSITVNEKNYPTVELDYDTVADLEEMGVSLLSGDVQTMPMIRAYVAICMRTDKHSAGKELQAHMENGGDLEEIAEVIGEMVENSGFFRILKEKAEKNAQ